MLLKLDTKSTVFLEPTNSTLFFDKIEIDQSVLQCLVIISARNRDVICVHPMETRRNIALSIDIWTKFSRLDIDVPFGDVSDCDIRLITMYAIIISPYR